METVAIITPLSIDTFSPVLTNVRMSDTLVYVETIAAVTRVYFKVFHTLADALVVVLEDLLECYQPYSFGGSHGHHDGI